MPKHYSLKNLDTFEIPPKCIARVYKKEKFMGWFNATYVYAQQQARLKLKEAMLTFVWLETLVENENRVIVRPNKIAKDLGVTVTTVYNHLAKMKEIGVIVPDEDDEDEKVVRVWRICPYHAWRGKGQYMAKYLSTLPEGHVFFNYTDPEFKKALMENMEEEMKDMGKMEEVEEYDL